MRPSASAVTSTFETPVDKAPVDLNLGLAAKYPPDTVPACYRSVFREYLKKVARNPLPRMMWVVLDNGHDIKQLEKTVYVSLAYKLLKSEDVKEARMAVEAMSRTLGIWDTRGDD